MKNKISFLLVCGLITSMLLSACYALPLPVNNPTPTASAAGPMVIITFRVRIPEPLPPGETIYLTQLDDVTGLAFNQSLFPMEAEDSLNFKLVQSIPQNAVIKYRYFRQGEYTVSEHTSDGQPVRYRLFHADAPGIIEDVVSRWTDSSSIASELGRITGKTIHANTGLPVANILVSAAGMQTWTATDGSFTLEGIPVGIHNMVAYAPDGAYQTFQQGATVAPGAATLANLQLHPSTFVQVVFIVEVPLGTPPSANIRLAGNLSQFGNSYADLRGGSASSAALIPVLQPLANGKFGATLNLPVGADLRYKYTLGDGIWNAEHSADGSFKIRQTIIPDRDLQIRDSVEFWSDSIQPIITFNVTVPENTPSIEEIVIQFNPGFAWMEPVPMWAQGSNQWSFSLFSPIGGLDTLQYRYCRDYQCGSADDSATAGKLSVGRQFSLPDEPLTIQDTVESWNWFEGEPATAVVPNIQIDSRGEGYITGFSFQENYHPTWLATLPNTLEDITSLNANWVVTRPAWSITRANPPVAQAVPGADLVGPDLNYILNAARARGLNTALFPAFHYPKTADVWWEEAVRDFSWWVSWFELYRSFILNQALLATQTGSSALILGDPSIMPSLPDGTLANGNTSQTPEDTLARWRILIQEIRQIYSGSIWWALQYPQDISNPPPFLMDVDGFYILWSAPLVANDQTNLDAMTAQAASILDEKILPLQQTYNKPIILAIEYPSAQGGSTGCLPGLESDCLDLSLLTPGNPDPSHISRDFTDQENAYNAVFLAIKDRPWVSGIISQDYYPPLVLQDKSASIHGKPGRGVLWFWFARLRGK
jgi:hypothetical protein